MKVTTQTTYTANDGKMFTDEKACLAYEAALAAIEKNVTYHRVLHKPDTTEGRGWYGCTYLKVYGPQGGYCLEELLHDYCFRTFGRPVQFVMGVAPIAGWILSTDTITKEDWIAARDGHRETRVGDYSYEATTAVLRMGAKETGLETDPWKLA